VKPSKRNRSLLSRILLAGLLVGTLAWELLERTAEFFGLAVSLQAGPVGFDAEVLKVELLVNPGSFIGLIGAYLLFRRL
jgi:hypothetical protein